MRLKAVSAATSAEAMQKLREELGPDAVILASEPEGDGNIRVIGAVDEVSPADGPAAAAPLPTITQPAGSIVDKALARLLEFHGAPLSVRAALQSGPAGTDATATLALRLEGAIQFANLADRRDYAPVLLVGLPGTGKTLAAAKLAARAIIAGRPARLVTTDTRSAGALEQIAAFAAPLKLEIETADTPGRLAAIVAKRRVPDALIVVDTQGVNPFDKTEMTELGALAAAAKADPVLVLPAGGDASETAEQAAAFAEIGCRRLLTTRIDTARRLGGMLAASCGGRLALAEIGASPVLAEGLQTLNALSLARLLVADRSVQPTAEENSS